jgi:hypothetical protein
VVRSAGSVLRGPRSASVEGAPVRPCRSRSAPFRVGTPKRPVLQLEPKAGRRRYCRGHGWANQGYTATEIDPQARGVGWLRAEDGIPRRIKAAYLTDQQIIDLAAWATQAQRRPPPRPDHEHGQAAGPVSGKGTHARLTVKISPVDPTPRKRSPEFTRWIEAKQSSSSKASRDAALEKTEKGQTALALVWVRKFRTHDVVEVSKVADVYSRYYTKIYGVLVWRPRSDFNAGEDGRDWHKFYDRHLEGRPVLDTLQAAISAMAAINPST